MKKLTLAATLLMLSVPAFAQMPPDFQTADADSSGTVSQAEMKQAMPDMTEDQWNQADTDKSGDLSETEYQQMMSHQ